MKNRKILVIEDNAINTKLVRDLLHIGNFDVLEAMDANTGIQLARQHHPALILMDIQLPGMNGLSATKVIKEDKMLKDIPVVAMTAHAMHGDCEKALESGCDAYISKPIDTRRFLEQISKLIKANTVESKT